MIKMSKRWAASLAASSLAISGMVFITAPAGADEEGATTQQCTVDNTVNILSYNDFHGRILSADLFFSIVEQQRIDHGEDNVLTISVGDDIGGSIFESMIDQDNPTLDILNAIELDVQAVGNHEFDKGWADLSGRVANRTDFNHLGANVYTAGTTNVAGPLLASEVFNVGGFNVGVVGAVTQGLPGLVDPSGIADLTIGNAVEAVNREAAVLAADDDVDFIVAAIHEGAADPGISAAANAAASEVFDQIYNGISGDVDLVLNGHTHQVYDDWFVNSGAPLMQAGSYASHFNSIEIDVDDQGNVCAISTEQIATPSGEPLVTTPRIEEIQDIMAAAEDLADELGAEVVGEATEAITTPTGNADKRDVESPITNAVAQMFHEVLGDGDPEFIGVQNPGGTRASFDEGEISYREAAMALPFANSLFITELTGAQVKTMLEQQWQRNLDGTVPSRPFLRLGLSDNVSYTYDESRDEGDRILSVHVGGQPIEPDKLYALGSGSFLISGGDQFHVFADGVNTRDAGRVDLEAWVSWVGETSPLSPDYSKRGVSVQTEVDSDNVTFTLGELLGEALADETLDMNLQAGEGLFVSPALANTTIVATIDGNQVATGTVVDGVGTIAVPRSSLVAGRTLVLTAEASGTTVHVPINADWPVADGKPGKPGKKPRPGLPGTGV